MIAGIYTFRLTVTNSTSQTAFDDVKITVISVNQVPLANAGADKSITLPTNSLIVNGSGTDNDGTIATYAWVKTSGPTATMAGQATANLSLSNLLQGTYVFALTVTDNLGATATDNVTLTVNAAAINQVPTASAGVDKSINLPTSSTSLAGTGSDPDGTIATYLWEKISGPAVTLANANSPTVSLSALVTGVYVFRITVTDNLGATGTDNATVTVIAANQSPVASAGADITITLPTNSTSVAGSGSDPDGTVSSYGWTQVTGPNTATLANIATSSLTSSNLIQGSYTFRLTVTDNKGATAFDDVKVIVNAAPVNVAPTANAGPDKSITLPVNSVVINGSGADTDGTVASYNWAKVSGPTTVLSNQTTPNLTAGSLVAGTYVFRLTVRDNLAALGTDLVTVTVQPAIVNQAPIADAGANISLTLPVSSTTINGSATDPDGTVASYAWTKVSGPAATLAGQTSASLQVSALVSGVYVFQLTATDNKGAIGSDNATVTVSAANIPPTANAGPDIILDLPSNSTIINGSGTDADGTVSSFNWSQVSGPAAGTFVNTNTNILTVSNLVAGTYTLRLTATDNVGATGTDDVKVIVNAANQTPTANAGPNKTITLPTSTVNFTGNGIDSDGTIASYAWTQTSGTAATLTNANTKTVTAGITSDGIYTFRLTVIDNGGASDFDDVILTVNAATVNQPPVANAGVNQTITLPVNFAELPGTAVDADGTITLYEWTKIGGTSATLANSNTTLLSLSDLVEGTYIFRLTVTDNASVTASDDVIINVLPAAVNQQPLANAGLNQSITLPVNGLTLFGSGSDPDGTVSTYLWTLESGSTATLTNENTPNLTLADLVEDVYVLRLTITDDDGATDFDEITVSVNAVAANQLPTASAGADQTISLPTSAANLTGSGSDQDGTISRYDWVKVSGPAATLGPVNQSSLAVSGLSEGIYIFRLEVEDNSGAIDTDDVKITVLPQAVNQPPVVSAGSNKSLFLPDNAVVLSGNATDADGSVASFVWTKVSGNAATLLNDNTSILTVNGMVQGVYVFRLSVADNVGATAFDEVTVTVNAVGVNQPPVANAGVDKVIKLPASTLSLTSLSFDSDGTLVTFLWTKISGPMANLANENTAVLGLSNLLEGTYQFELTVTDDLGGTATDHVAVTVLPASINIPPDVNAGPDIDLQLPQNSIVLNGTANDDGFIAELLWTKVSGPAATISGETTLDLSLTNLVAGTYLFKLQAKDDQGMTSFENVSVRVSDVTAPAGPPPTVSAGVDLILDFSDNHPSIVAIAEAPGGLITSYEWIQTAGVPVSISFPDSSVLILNGLLPGDYTFNVTVKDQSNQIASDEVKIHINDAPYRPFNVFSPNNDNPENDVWIIENAGLLDQCQITVFNRAGQKVYESVGYPTPWDGTFNGQVLPDGVYFYVIRCTGEVSMNGTVTIIH
jgi:gliding motility-associated-like protein